MKRGLLLITLFLVFGISFSQNLESIKKFFERKGYVVEKLDHKIVLDLGKGSAFVGEVFEVIKEGKKLVHPVTGEVLGTTEEAVGKVRITEVKDKFSFAEILEDRGIEKGNRVRLYYESVCFVGSEEGYFKISSLVGTLKREENCDYVVRELERGFGVERKGIALAFFEKPAPKKVQQTVEKKTPEEFRLHAKFIFTFPELPLSADVCNLFGDEKDYIAVLFGSKLRIYEVLRKELVEYASMNLPAGYPVSVQCAPLDRGRDVILLNMVSGGSMSSALVKVVGSTPVIVKKDIPYFMAVLDKSRAEETFVGQKFDGSDFWGSVKRLKLEGEDIVELEDFPVPSGFRIDSAILFKDLLIFTDEDGYLRVYRGDELLLSEENFSGSYTTAELPGTYEDENKYIFNPRYGVTEVLGEKYPVVIKNITSPVYRFLDVAKFSEGEIYILVSDSRGRLELKKVIGRKFEEAIQAVLATRDGRTFVITGRTGTLPLQNRGDIFEVEIEPY